MVPCYSATFSSSKCAKTPTSAGGKTPAEKSRVSISFLEPVDVGSPEVYNSVDVALLGVNDTMSVAHLEWKALKLILFATPHPTARTSRECRSLIEKIIFDLETKVDEGGNDNKIGEEDFIDCMKPQSSAQAPQARK